MVLAQAVRDEVEEALLIRVEGMDRVTSDRILQGYERLLDLTRPHVVAYPSAADVAARPPSDKTRRRRSRVVVSHREQARLAAD